VKKGTAFGRTTRGAELAGRLRRARLTAGLTQEELAGRLGTVQRRVSQSEQTTLLRLDWLTALLDAGLDPKILCPELVERTRPARKSARKPGETA